MNVASLASDYLPEPPTPNKSAFPKGCLKILAILATWSQASKKRISFI